MQIQSFLEIEKLRHFGRVDSIRKGEAARDPKECDKNIKDHLVSKNFQVVTMLILTFMYAENSKLRGFREIVYDLLPIAVLCVFRLEDDSLFT